MKWYDCESSNIREWAYDSKTHTMLVTFHSGRTYKYFDVTENDRRAMRRAKSKGRRFNLRIKAHDWCEVTHCESATDVPATTSSCDV